MIRLLLRLLRIKDFEPCKSCETLKLMLEYERAEKRELSNILISILQPKLVEQPPAELEPIEPKAMLWSRRRVKLEREDAENARIKKNSTLMGRSDDSISKLETELGVSEVEEKEA